MIDPGALGTLRIGLDAIEAESQAHRRHRSATAPRRARTGLRVALATGLRRVAAALERPSVNEAANP